MVSQSYLHCNVLKSFKDKFNFFFHFQDVTPKSEAKVIFSTLGRNFAGRPIHLTRVNRDIFTFVSRDNWHQNGQKGELVVVDLSTGSLTLPSPLATVDSKVSCIVPCGPEHLLVYSDGGPDVHWSKNMQCRGYVMVPNRPRRVADYLRSREYLLLKRWECKKIEYLN